MKVFDFTCARAHRFEGWFASHDEFERQRGLRLVSCPLCGSFDVTKNLSAPYVNTGAPRPLALSTPDPEPTPKKTEAVESSNIDRATLLIAMMLHIKKNTEDVGPRFADEARAMHYGDKEARSIRGQATPDEREALEDEGIEFASLPMPVDLPEIH